VRLVITAIATVLAAAMDREHISMEFRMSDVPKDRAVIDWIKPAINWDDAVNCFDKQFDPELMVPGLSFSPDIIESEVRSLYGRCTPICWKSRENPMLYGLSLSCNPDHEPLMQKGGSFGHERYRKETSANYYKAVQEDKLNRVKGDYLDSYGFRKILPQAADLKYLMGILRGFNVPVIRSTIRTTNGYLCVKSNAEDGGMHQDDSPFEVLRVNLCITNNGHYGFQYRGCDPIVNQPGSHMVINTDHDHRVWYKQPSHYQRTHIIIGLAPWLDYNESNDSWSPNKFFGAIHPYDMVRKGLIYTPQKD
jgi:hypothetical protein